MREEEIDDDVLTVQRLELPDFKPKLPDHLLEGLTRREHHTLMTLDVMAQRLDWLCHNVIEQNEQMRRLERDHLRLRKFKDMIANKWSVIAAIILYFLPQVVPKLIALLAK